ncbi:hypothetical protein LN996_00850 [Arthrobacter sp. AK01]|uniref:hypothetical protein n=1 Tax=Arthrobacter sp. AK01 TaxID=2894084 RepID=UPI001E5E3E32|nr:hypothetical protein [Arthrobacter sp. AK01]MCD4849349.1 hypothetical protein [Arthrobacter sp. AK01]
MHRKLWALAAALTVVTLAAGCSSTPDGPTREPSSAPAVTASPAPLAESTAKYDSLRAELIAALEKQMPDITWAADDPASVTQSKDGKCVFHPQTMKSSADIVEPSKNFEEVFAAADPVLKQHGFPAFDGTDSVPGGWVVTRSTDGVGATVTIESKSPAYLRMTVPVQSESCDTDELSQEAK